jgi:hypothetical protein
MTATLPLTFEPIQGSIDDHKFLRFYPILGENGLFLKANVMVQILQKLAVF